MGMKSHLQSYPCPLQINFFWNFGFFLGVAIVLQIVTGIFLALHFTSDLNSAYSSVFFIFILVEHHLSFIFYFYILEELCFMVHTFIIQIFGFQEFFFSSSPCLIEWICGGYCVHSPTLKRFFVFHFQLP